jgi:hypothetical protein
MLLVITQSFFYNPTQSKTVMNSKTKFAALAAMAVTLSVAMLVSSLATPVQAKITPAQPPSCENPAGNEPGGQQPTCQGEGLTQNEAKPARNPAGNEPPGQQP